MSGFRFKLGFCWKTLSFLSIFSLSFLAEKIERKDEEKIERKDKEKIERKDKEKIQKVLLLFEFVKQQSKR